MPSDPLAQVRVLGEHRTLGLGLPEAIRQAHREGFTYRAIAEAAGISFQRVAQIVKAKEEK